MAPTNSSPWCRTRSNCSVSARQRTFSSRRIARKLEEDVAYRVLAAGNFPAHRTIAEFRQQYLAAFEALFVQVLAIAREARVVQLGAAGVGWVEGEAHERNAHGATTTARTESLRSVVAQRP